MKININYQNSIQLNENIYIDPYKLTEYTDAKYIFITHSHYDHLSPEDITKIITNNTIVIAPTNCLNDLLNLSISKDNILLVEPNKEYQLEDISFKTVRAYNINKQFHPKENNWVGYIININNETSYIVGDSDYIEEMNNIKCDNLFIPCGGIYTMDVEEAIEAIDAIKPKNVYPTHYGSVVPNSNKNGIILQDRIKEKYNVKLFL